MKKYCIACDKDTAFEIVEKEVLTTINSITFTYLAHIPYCLECGNEIYIGELSDKNIQTANNIYRKLTGLSKNSSSLDEFSK